MERDTVEAGEILSNAKGYITSVAPRRTDYELDDKESRLIDLAADATLPQAKTRSKLHGLQRDRARIEVGLASTREQLSVGAGVLRDALYLVSDPQELYSNVNDKVRRHLNETFYEALYIDEVIDVEVTDDKKTTLFAELHEGADASINDYLLQRPNKKSPRLAEALPSSVTDLLTFSDLSSVKVSSRPVMVGQ